MVPRGERMGVITISRQLGSRGDEIGRLLVEKEGYRCLDKESLEETFKRDGVSLGSVERYDERSPRFFRHFSRDKNTYLHFLKSAVYDCARDRHAVIFGRGGHLILADLPGVLSLRFTAPREVRIARVARESGASEEEAAAMIEHSDAAREGFHRFFFNRSWDSPRQYDLTFNSERIDNSCLVDMIKRALEDLNRPEVVKETANRLDNLFLTQEVISQIVYRDRIPVQNLEVDCHDGEAFLRGMVMIEEHVRLVKESAQKVAGIHSVRSEIYFIPSYTYVMR